VQLQNKLVDCANQKEAAAVKQNQVLRLEKELDQAKRFKDTLKENLSQVIYFVLCFFCTFESTTPDAKADLMHRLLFQQVIRHLKVTNTVGSFLKMFDILRDRNDISSEYRGGLKGRF